MKFKEMTSEEAIKFLRTEGKGKNVLVAVQNLETKEDVPFAVMLKSECESIIEKAQTISSICDDFSKQLNCFTEKQRDFPTIRAVGEQYVILLKS